jgi:hypothetical protein
MEILQLGFQNNVEMTLRFLPQFSFTRMSFHLSPFSMNTTSLSIIDHSESYVIRFCTKMS